MHNHSTIRLTVLLMDGIQSYLIQAFIHNYTCVWHPCIKVWHQLSHHRDMVLLVKNIFLSVKAYESRALFLVVITYFYLLAFRYHTVNYHNNMSCCVCWLTILPVDFHWIWFPGNITRPYWFTMQFQFSLSCDQYSNVSCGDKICTPCFISWFVRRLPRVLSVRNLSPSNNIVPAWWFTLVC